MTDMTVGAFLGVFALMFVLELPRQDVRGDRDHEHSGAPVDGCARRVTRVDRADDHRGCAGSLLTLFPVHWKDLIVGVALPLGRPVPALRVRVRRRGQGSTRSGAGEGDSRWKEVTTAFIVIFIGEFGDLTQIQGANFEAKLHNPRSLPGAPLALICVSFIGAYSGRRPGRVISLKRIDWWRFIFTASASGHSCPGIAVG